ncbi:MAG: fibronectin type III domain-containing protein [Candidatus Manganitrophus sp.]|nr:MAG: fibronectin type III domain-containing protein [Candidatus Manganitrophus sp.]
MRFQKHFIFSVWMILFLTACSGGGSESSDTARVGLTIKVPSAVGKVSAPDRVKSHAPAPTQIAAISVNVANANGLQLTSTRVAVSPGQEVTLTLEVPAGRARIFTVQALDEAGTVLFQGEVSADLTAGVSTTLAIQMSPVNLPSTLSINPTTLSILVGKTQRFTATVTGPADPALTWSVNNIVTGNAAFGTIVPSDDATTALYTAPAALPDSNPVTIKVSSASHPELAATAVVTLLALPSTIFVDGAAGGDGPDCGTETAPCKTITQGLALAQAGQTLLVSAGTYHLGNGTGEEPAPLTMKRGVDIQGAGAETTILNLNSTQDSDGAGILGADDATLSGFTIQSDDSVNFHVSLTGNTMISDNRFIDLCDRCSSTAVRARGNGAPILNGNTFGQIEAGLTVALRVEDTASPTVTRNTFTGNDTAIEARSSTAPKVEANAVIGNEVGISILGSSSPDLGGGQRESNGGNTISCNTTADITLGDTVQTILAHRNFWDHLPPTVSSEPGSGIDIVGEGIDAAEAASASPHCVTEPPMGPFNLIATARSQNQISLSWSPSVDNFGVITYQIDRCRGANCTGFEQITETTETIFDDIGLSPATPYSYRVRAVDVDDNVSPDSNVAGATTPDESAPTPPTDLTANPVSEIQINLSWGPSTDDVGVAGYRVERCRGADCIDFVEITRLTGTTFSDTALSAGTTYRYRVRAVDGADNFSGYSNTAAATTRDTTPPTPPINLTASAVGETRINLSWGASNDNVGVTEYRVERCQGATCTNFLEIGQPTGTTFNDTGRSAAVTYRYRVRAADAANNFSGYSNIATATTPDTTPPTPPINLTATVVGGTQINLAWGASTDNVGVMEYRIERCQGVNCTTFAQIATRTVTNFSNTGLTSATSYSYRVRAVDAAGNLSGFSNTATRVTLDTIAPTTPGNLTATAAGETQINLSWGASTDNVGVTGYRVERCQGANCATFTEIAQPTGTTFNDAGRTPGVPYSYRVRAVDAAGNFSGYSNTAGATTRDVTSPTPPTNLTATTASETQINLSWGASSDNVGVREYRVERCQGTTCTNFAEIAQPTATAFNDTGRSPATAYRYRVRAVDTAGNLGGYSNIAAAVTLDTTAPTPPANLVGNAISEIQINLSWGASSDNVGVARYGIERCQGTNCINFAEIAQPTTATFNNTGLSAGTPYRYRVRAADAAGNLSGYSNIVTIVTLDTTAPTIPSGLSARTLNQSEIGLSWNPSTDNVGVIGYRLERCLATGASCVEIDTGSAIDPTKPSFNDTGLATATAYTYRVRAYDAAGNLSLYSQSAGASTGRILFHASFDIGNLDQPPETTLIGDPVGDSLSLSTAAGTILVRSFVGNMDTRPVELNQVAERTGGVDLRGTVAGTPPKSGIYTARWRSLVSSREVGFAAIVLRDSAGRIVASLAYRPNGILDYNDRTPSNGIGVFWRQNFAQTFEIEVDLNRKTTLLRIDGRIVMESVPFYEAAAADLARISMELGTTSAQTLAWDDIDITATVP